MLLASGTVFLLLGNVAAQTYTSDSFGSGSNAFSMNFVTIGNPGNAGEMIGSNSLGDVGYTYRIGVNEVSGAMIDAYNALSGGPTITRNGSFTTSQPAMSISWNEAARFVNWLNVSQGYSAAYKFTTGGANDNIALWISGDSGYNATNPFRNSNAHYFLPSEDEWFKAAYYDPNANGGTGGYWDFPTGSDTAPTAVASGTTSGTAVYYGYHGGWGPADITNAGGLSPYGTMAQGGNAAEWSESPYAVTVWNPAASRVWRGGTYQNFNASFQMSSSRGSELPTAESHGFRVAAVVPVPEPSSALLVCFAGLAILFRQRRS
ncbi:MAG: SUMF1/EgtB/PvdO family nonheme iron enzyme [Chthoniobacterales bacterium]